MEQILLAIVGFLLEWMFYSSIYLPFGFATTKVVPAEAKDLDALTCLKCFVTGCGVGWISLLLFKHAFVSNAGMRVALLVLSPLTAAYLTKSIAKYMAKTNTDITPSHHFWYAFWFTVGFAALRFAYVMRS